MKALTITIELLEPTLVIMFGSGDANQLTTAGYIPGTVLRNTLATDYIKENKLSDKAALDETCRRLFFDDQIRFLNAYPVNRKSQRTLPTPISWYAGKENLADFHNRDIPLPIFDFSHNSSQDIDSPKNPDLGFCSFRHTDNEDEAPDVEFFAARRRVAVHNVRTTRRMMIEDESSLFQFEALAEGQRFMGVILADDDVDLLPLKNTLSKADFSFGKSRSAGYGRVKITINPSGEMSDWSEYIPPQDFEDFETDDRIVITLLSPALVRESPKLGGAYIADISYALGVAPEKLVYASYRTEIVGGFNRKWGMPLPQSLAVQMGSVFVYPAGEIDKTRLASFVEEGIGERRAEGFGRIAVNWHRYPQLQGIKISSGSGQNRVELDPTTHSGQLAQRIVTHQLRRKLDFELLKVINSLKIKEAPSRSQLSRIRLAARKTLETGTLEELKTYLNVIRGKTGPDKTARTKTAYQVLRRSHIGNESLYDWLESHLNPDEIKKTLTWRNEQPELGSISVDFDKDEALKIEYTARLIEGVVKREIDCQRQEGGNNG